MIKVTEFTERISQDISLLFDHRSVRCLLYVTFIRWQASDNNVLQKHEAVLEVYERRVKVVEK